MRLLYLLVFVLIFPISVNAAREVSTLGSNIGIGTNSQQNALSVRSTLAVGSSTYTSTTAPTNGAIIEGNLGVGVSAPNNKLEVNGTTSTTDLKVSSLNAGECVQTTTGGQLTTTGAACGSGSGSGTNYWNLSSGNVGINTTNNVGISSLIPGQKLDVNGTVRATAFIGDGSGLTGISGGSGSNYWSLNPGNTGINTTNSIGLGTNSVTNKLNILGNVGLGTMSGDNYLTVPATSGGINIGGNLGVGTWLPGSKVEVMGGGIKGELVNKGWEVILTPKTVNTVSSTFSEVNSMYVYKNYLYIGYDTDGYASSQVWRWDGNTMEQMGTIGTGSAFGGTAFLIEYKGNLYAGTQGSAGGNGDVYVSTDDGANWSKSLENTTNQFAYAASVFKGKLFVGAGYSAGTIYSFDGTTWSTAYSGTTNARLISDLKVYKGLLFASGAASSGGSSSILSSPDGTTWTSEVSVAIASVTQFNRFEEFNGKLYCGAIGTNAPLYVRDDSTGTWSVVATFTGGQSWGLQEYNGNLYVGITTGGTAAGKVYKSPDGVNWTVDLDPYLGGSGGSSPAYEPFRMIKYNGSLYVGYGGNGRYSADLWRKTESLGELWEKDHKIAKKMRFNTGNGFNYSNDESSIAITSPLILDTNLGIGTSEVNNAKLVITGGNVGLGSVVPGQALDVQGTVRATAFIGNLTGNVTGDVTGNLTGNVTGNSSTATALAVNPTGCSSGDFVNDIDADGTLTCGTPSGGGGVGVGTVNAGASGMLTYYPSAGTTVDDTTIFSNGANLGIGTSLVTNSSLTVMNGNVGIGTWKPVAGLHIKSGAGGATIGYLSTAPSTDGLLVAGNTSIGTTENGNVLTVVDPTADDSNFALSVKSNGTQTAQFISRKAASSTSGGGIQFGTLPGSAMTSGQRLGFLIFQGSSDASNTAGNAAAVQAYADGTWTGSSIPAYLTFSTAPAGSTTRTENLRVTSGGNVGIGTTIPASKLGVGGNQSIGAAYSTISAPSNGLIVQGNTGLGVSAPVNLLDVNGGMVVGSYAGANTAPSNGITASGNVGLGTWIANAKLSMKQTAISGREKLLEATTSDATGDIWAVTNSTSTDSRFSPAFVGSTTSNAGTVPLSFIGEINSGTDSGSTGVVYFAARQVSGDYINGTFSDITARPTFVFLNNGTTQMLVNAGGNVGIGSTNPGQKLDITGTGRMTGFILTGNGASAGNVLVTNSVGLGTWMAASTLPVSGGSGTINSGTTSRSARYSGATTLDSSTKIFDDGTNVGIGTIAPRTAVELGVQVVNIVGSNVGIGSITPGQLLDVQGTIRAINIITSGSGDSYTSGNLGVGTATPGQALDINGRGRMVGLGTTVPNPACIKADGTLGWYTGTFNGTCN